MRGFLVRVILFLCDEVERATHMRGHTVTLHVTSGGEKSAGAAVNKALADYYAGQPKGGPQ
jgi:hypothetical protein